MPIPQSRKRGPGNNNNNNNNNNNALPKIDSLCFHRRAFLSILQKLLPLSSLYRYLLTHIKIFRKFLKPKIVLTTSPFSPSLLFILAQPIHSESLSLDLLILTIHYIQFKILFHRYFLQNLSFSNYFYFVTLRCPFSYYYGYYVISHTPNSSPKTNPTPVHPENAYAC